MNRGVIEKAIREAASLTLILGVALMLVEGLLGILNPPFPHPSQLDVNGDGDFNVGDLVLSIQF